MFSKKFFIKTVSISALLTIHAHADIDVLSTKGKLISIGGALDLQAGTRLSNKSSNLPPLSPNNRHISFDSAATMHGSAKFFHNDWIYGVQLGLKMTTLNSDPTGSDALDRTYIYAEDRSKMRIEFGTNRSAASAMKLSGSSVAVGSGGVGGSWSKFAAVNSYTNNNFSQPNSNPLILNSSNFIKSPKLVLQDGELIDGSHEKYRKMTIYLPFSKKFKFGISYGPDGSNVGSKAYSDDFIKNYSIDEVKIRTKNPITFGLSWKNDITKDESLEASLIGESGSYNPVAADGNDPFNNPKALMIGGVYTKGNVSVGASYSNHFKSHYRKQAKNTGNAYVASLGVKYNMNKFATSLTYMFSSLNNNTFHAAVIGISYNILSNISSYAELAYFNANQKNIYDLTSHSFQTSKAKNSGIAMLIGTRVDI